jgi:hypothetical protein
VVHIKNLKYIYQFSVEYVSTNGDKNYRGGIYDCHGELARKKQTKKIRELKIEKGRNQEGGDQVVTVSPYRKQR